MVMDAGSMNLAAGDDLASAGRDRFNAMNAIDDVTSMFAVSITQLIRPSAMSISHVRNWTRESF